MKKILLYGILPVLVLSLAACTNVLPDGEYVTEEREVDGYTSVSVEGGIRLILTDRPNHAITVTTYENIQPYVETYVKGKQLIIRTRRNIAFTGDARIRAYVGAAGVTALNASGGANVESAVAIETPSLEISMSGGSSFNHETGINASDISYSVSGGGSVKGSLTSEKVRSVMSGGSVLHLEGNVNVYDLKECSGGSVLHGYALTAETLSCDLSGGSEVKMTVLEQISVKASGGSHVKYRGMAELVSSDLSGGSKITRE